MSFSIRVTAHRGVAHLIVTGELDLVTRPELQAAVNSHLEDATIERIVVDLANVTFLDSTGIGALIGCKNLAAEVGKHVQAVGAVGQVASVLDLTGVTAFLAQ